MLKGLLNINENLPTSSQLSAVKFIEDITGLLCPTPLTLVNVETFISDNLDSANESYFDWLEDDEYYLSECGMSQ